MICIRHRLEDREEALSPLAAKARFTKGRSNPEPECSMRTAFQRDRDRIIHSKSFRRLKHKTQVFVAPIDDHYRTRLTHTLEVAQIARTISRALNLNEDLTEAIAMGHDLGHTPFGHAGEETLDRLVPGGFRHNEQSLRIVERLEKSGKGLNLTHEVKNGILYHSKPREGIAAGNAYIPETLEGQVVKLADSVAYINHDLEDAFLAGVIRPDDLPKDLVKALGEHSSERINRMVQDIIEYCSWVIDGELPPEKEKDKLLVRPSPEMLNRIDTLRGFMFERVYHADPAKTEGDKAAQIIEQLFNHFVQNPHELPVEWRTDDEEICRSVADYVTSMTDQYAFRLFDFLFISDKAVCAI